MRAILARQVEMKAAYEDRLAEARAQLDEAASRQLLERNSFNSKVNEVVSRQARLEQRGAIVAALVKTEAERLRPRLGGAEPRRCWILPTRSAQSGLSPRRGERRKRRAARRAPTLLFPIPSSLG